MYSKAAFIADCGIRALGVRPDAWCISGPAASRRSLAAWRTAAPVFAVATVTAAFLGRCAAARQSIKVHTATHSTTATVSATAPVVDDMASLVELAEDAGTTGTAWSEIGCTSLGAAASVPFADGAGGALNCGQPGGGGGRGGRTYTRIYTPSHDRLIHKIIQVPD